MGITAREVNASLKENDDLVLVWPDDEEAEFSEIVNEECDFKLSDFPGTFVHHTSVRDRLQPDVYWFVWKYDATDQFFGVSGYYDSWHGVDIEEYELYELIDQPVTIDNWTIVKPTKA